MENRGIILVISPNCGIEFAPLVFALMYYGSNLQIALAVSRHRLAYSLKNNALVLRVNKLIKAVIFFDISLLGSAENAASTLV